MRSLLTVGCRRSHLAWALATALLMFGSGVRADEASCGQVTNAYGPYDYRTATKAQLQLVEHAHFTLGVERLTKGESTAYVGGDLDYTLRAFPNHYRALMSMSKLSIRDNRPTPTGARFSIECYFDRAFRFQPDDPMPRMVAGVHYAKLGRANEARENLDMAAQLSTGDNANLDYNLGLAYFDLKDFDKALVHAKKAYDAGFPLPGLRNKLQQAGVWKE